MLTSPDRPRPEPAPTPVNVTCGCGCGFVLTDGMLVRVVNGLAYTQRCVSDLTTWNHPDPAGTAA